MSGENAESNRADVLRELDSICDRYEAAWRGDVPPRLEDFLNLPSGHDESRHSEWREELLRELLTLELTYRERAGQRPTREEYCDRFPSHQVIVERVFQEYSRQFVETQQLRSTEIGSNAEAPAASSLRDEPSLERLGRYEIEGLLGSGTFGAVYLATDTELNRRVAIKVPHSKVFHDETAVAKFIAEARTVAKLKHPGIVSIYDVGRSDDGKPYLVMEYVAGRTLDQLIKSEAMSTPEVVELAAQLADAVGYAHREGIVHRDLKPANVLVSDAGTVHVTDFGLAVDEQSQREKAGEFAGTLAYMSPEQVRAETHHLDGRCDIWALGVMIYEMLLNRRPFGGESIKEMSDEILHREPKPPRQIREDLPPELEQIVLKCCQKEISRRYTTASDVAADLRRVTAASSRAGLEPAPAIEPAGELSGNSGHTNPSVFAGRPLAITLVLTGLIIFGVLIAWSPWRASSNSEETPWAGNIDVLVWNEQVPNRVGLGLHEAGVLPLRPKDQVRVTARVDRPAYLYIVWIDSEGVPLPIYPWDAGDWDSRPDREAPVDSVDLPADLGGGWEIHGQPGMESLLLLARDTPLPESVSLQSLLEEQGTQKWQTGESLVEFENGELVTFEQDQTRGPKSFAVTDLNDPVMTLQRKIRDKLRPHFEYVRTISFANGYGES